MLANLIVWAAIGQVGEPDQGPKIQLSAGTESAIRRACTPHAMERTPPRTAFIICRHPAFPDRDEQRRSIASAWLALKPRAIAFGVRSSRILLGGDLTRPHRALLGLATFMPSAAQASGQSGTKVTLLETPGGGFQPQAAASPDGSIGWRTIAGAASSMRSIAGTVELSRDVQVPEAPPKR